MSIDGYCSTSYTAHAERQQEHSDCLLHVRAPGVLAFFKTLSTLTRKLTNKHVMCDKCGIKPV